MEEQFTLAKNIPSEDRENYEAIIIDKEITFKLGGVRGETGIVFNRDPVTGEEEYGFVSFLEPEIGPNIASGGVGIKTYNKLGAPIKDFQGFFGTVKGTAGYGLRGSGEIEINGHNNVNYDINFTVRSGTIGFLAGIGYRKVWKINPPDWLKLKIKSIIENRESIKEKYESIDSLKDIIDYSETLK
ncbi:MAG: hypothetical protein Q4A58_01665 [Fusobacterium sp.]|uniref:hypothetical protein n=1 Tax=Fusobacterium sp. TaxID=68766 RepID=UPI0026DAC083|nr:hypothetical protein [Fusobacterium sp.]MDO4689992.1 hypothetical protein [Fusobacterium sp.]